ncbi:MAG TPA: hypothetical protein VJP79_04265 [Nitrososphaera sp.]|nr:hypothetical protein [Nitrososphaera sp.]
MKNNSSNAGAAGAIVSVAALAAISIILITSVAASSSSSFAVMQAFADPLKGASKQRIGNYDFEMTTDPKAPAAGKPATIMLRFAGVNGDDLIDVPISIRIVKDGAELYKPNPVVVPYGHHNFEFTFPEQGMYALYVDLNDYAYSGQTLTFTFLINVSSPLDFNMMMPVAGVVVGAAAVGATVVIKRKRLAAK